MGRGFFYFRRQAGRRSLLRALVFTSIVSLLAAMFYATAQMRPLLESLATTRVSNTVNGIVSAAVDEAIENGDISYDDLISFETDNEGRISAVYSNMAAFNRLQSKILDIILERIGQVSARDLSIPVGTLTGSALRRHQPDEAPDRAENRRGHQHSAPRIFHRRGGFQRSHRGGNGHRRLRSGHLRLLQLHGRRRRPCAGLYLRITKWRILWTTAKKSGN